MDITKEDNITSSTLEIVMQNEDGVLVSEYITSKTRRGAVLKACDNVNDKYGDDFVIVSIKNHKQEKMVYSEENTVYDDLLPTKE